MRSFFARSKTRKRFSFSFLQKENSRLARTRLHIYVRRLHASRDFYSPLRCFPSNRERERGEREKAGFCPSCVVKRETPCVIYVYSREPDLIARKFLAIEHEGRARRGRDDRNVSKFGGGPKETPADPVRPAAFPSPSLQSGARERHDSFFKIPPARAARRTATRMNV